MPAMRKIIFPKLTGANLTLFILIAILGPLTVFLTGYLSVNLSPAVYISIISFMVILTIITLLLIKIDLAVPMLIMLLPIEMLIRFSFQPSINSDVIWVFNVLEITVIPASICCLLYKATNHHRTGIVKLRTGSEYIYILVFAFVLYGISSVFWSPDIGDRMWRSIMLFLHFCMYLLFFHLIKTKENIIRAIRTLIFTAMMTAVTMLISIFPIDVINIHKTYPLTNNLNASFIFGTYQLRAYGLMEPHASGVFLGFGVLFSLGLLSQSRDKKEKVILSLIIIFLIGIALYTKARGAIISMLLSIVFLIFAMKKFREYLFRNLFIFAFCFLVLLGIFTTTHSYLMDYIKPYLPSMTELEDSSIEYRFKYWKTMFTVMADNAVMLQGLGIGGTAYYLSPVPHAHNFWLSIFFDFGLIGFILFLILKFIALTKLLLTVRTLKDGFAKAMLVSTLGCIISFGLAALVDFEYNFKLLWILMGIGASIYRYAISTQKESVVE